MFKKITALLGVFGIVLTVSGCDFRQDNMDGISIYTTNYATEYITNRLYGEHSEVYSIYPTGVDINSYNLTNKQIKDYSSSDLYIFNGLSAKEKEYVNSMRSENDNLKIIDTTLLMEYTNGIEELWLDPSNFLMMAQNIKKGFAEYISNYYLNNDISNNYEELKIEASNLDAKIKQTVSNAENKVIVTSSNMFKFLEKYGLTVYALESSGTSNKTIEDVKSLISSGKIKYVFIKDSEEVNDVIKSVTEGTGVETLNWYTLSNISDEQRNNNEDYFSLMNENIELLKNELYE